VPGRDGRNPLCIHAEAPRLLTSLTLGGLFVSAFLSATLLPGNSELVLAGLLVHDRALYWPALAAATLGNTLGGLSSYLLGRLAPARQQPGPALRWVQRWGSAALLLSWVPVVGDALCVAAGWLRVHAGWAALYLALGKLARYWLVAQAAVRL
jgi:membrane protein YqaA with SNARE-associated domain